MLKLVRERIGTKPINNKEMIFNFLFHSSGRFFQVLGLSSLSLILVAAYFEYVLLLKPCLLCYAQRFCVYLVILTCLVAFLHKNQSIKLFKIYISTSLVFLASGISLAIRQLYLQSLPLDLIPTCGPDIDYLFDTLPFFEVFMLAIRGDGNCAEVLWSFMGISIPGWTLVGFFILFSYSLFSLFISTKLHSKN